jgi:hypothetical protein
MKNTGGSFGGKNKRLQFRQGNKGNTKTDLAVVLAEDRAQLSRNVKPFACLSSPKLLRSKCEWTQLHHF